MTETETIIKNTIQSKFKDNIFITRGDAFKLLREIGVAKSFLGATTITKDLNWVKVSPARLIITKAEFQDFLLGITQKKTESPKKETNVSKT